MKHSLFSVFISLLLFQNLFANEIDSTLGKYSWSIRSDYGFLIAHRPALQPLQESHILGLEISIGKISAGENEWERDFLNPARGLTLAFFDLGNTTKLGNGIALYPYIDFPLNKKSDGRLLFRYGIGLGWIEKIFNSSDNYKNAAIGSHINGVIHLGLHFEKRITPLSSADVGAAITHFSNGAFKIPNLGINVATFNLTYIRFFGDKKIINKIPLVQKERIKEWSVYVAGGLKKIYPPEGKQYQAGVVSFSHSQSIQNRSFWSAGIDAFFDNSLSVRITNANLESKGFSDDLRLGFFGGYEIRTGKTGLLFNMGYYLFSRWKEDGAIYHRICIRQHFGKLFLCLNLKTHYARADFVEFGIGTKL